MAKQYVASSVYTVTRIDPDDGSITGVVGHYSCEDPDTGAQWPNRTVAITVPDDADTWAQAQTAIKAAIAVDSEVAI